MADWMELINPVANINFLLVISIENQENGLWESILWSPKENALIFYQIFSANSVGKCVEIILENLYGEFGV